MGASDNGIMDEVETRLDEIFGDVEHPNEADSGEFSAETPRPSEETTGVSASDRNNPWGSSRPIDLNGERTSHFPDPAAQAPFGDVLSSAAPSDSAGENGRKQLENLKKLVLSIEWEITDGVMSRFIEEVAKQRENYCNDKVLVVLCKMLDSLGRYILKNKGQAHPGAAGVLNSVFAGLERIVTQSNPEEDLKERILASELEGFKRLQDQIMKKQPHRKAEKASQPLPVLFDKDGKADESSNDSLTAIREVTSKLLEEMKTFVHSEMVSLKKEMKRMLEENSDKGVFPKEPDGIHS